ncbi:hypothetical protein [Bdellovibrio svalbardensis]|uniref:Uncharacterized protein n=1 Tax=Bdellovibrio svalbardensis TaxID=2972972 RepID=A0ABT6DM97_9BACT|nr:hypothetical protein [Bdellovibrio svalbardensis]MDG0817205.1 hypothetical protein [Bdellovibrio svalbardensis]
MKKTSLLLALAILTPVFASAASIVKFETMYGVDGPFVGGTQIRGVLGDELPWTIKSATGSLSTAGDLKISVKGLVFSDDDVVPPELRGINDEKEFRGMVSCMSETASGGVSTKNVLTAGFPATKSGNSEINGKVKLPSPCLAPIVFVMAGSEEKWFAVTGFEMEAPKPKH